MMWNQFVDSMKDSSSETVSQPPPQSSKSSNFSVGKILILSLYSLALVLYFVQ